LTFAELDDAPFEKLKSRFSRVRGLDGQVVTVSSAATVLASLMNAVEGHHHVPGPLGLVGGYPVLITEGGNVEIDLPPGINLSNAVAINQKAQKFDGLHDVQPGSVTLTNAARTALKEIVGIELPTVTTGNVGDLAAEMVERLNTRYAFGLQL
jgi:hypothetical protein